MPVLWLGSVVILLLALVVKKIMAQYGEDKNQKQELAEARAEIERLRQKLGQQNDDQAAERGRWLIERSNQMHP